MHLSMQASPSLEWKPYVLTLTRGCPDSDFQVVIAAAETMNPHKSIPKATKRVTYRILFFYVLGALLIGMIVPYNQADLVSGADNANSSPWVIAIKEAGIPALDSIVNVGLCPGDQLSIS